MNQFLLEYETITPRAIPVITCQPQGTTNLPMVIVNHGTGGSAEGMLPFVMRLAKEGFFCVAIDALWHGARSDGKLQEHLTPKDYKKNYLHLLLHMADDMTAVIDHFSTDSRVNIEKIGMTGVSQGGYVTFMTMTKDHRLTAAAPMIGSPDLTDKYGNSLPWEEIDPTVQQDVITHNPLNHAEKMPPTALLIQNAIEDKIVPIDGARRLDAKLKPLYQSAPEQYRFIEYPEIGHEVPEAMQGETVRWFVEKLK